MLSWHGEGMVSEQHSQALLPKILLQPGSPVCHVAAPGPGSAHQLAGLCSGKGWKSWRREVFHQGHCSELCEQHWLHILTAESSTEETWGKANTEVAQQAGKSQIWVF